MKLISFNARSALGALAPESLIADPARRAARADTFIASGVFIMSAIARSVFVGEIPRQERLNSARP